MDKAELVFQLIIVSILGKLSSFLTMLGELSCSSAFAMKAYALENRAHHCRHDF